MQTSTRAAILFVLAVVLAPLLVALLLFVSFAASQHLCAIIYRGNHEGISDLCGVLTVITLFVVLLIGSLSAYAFGRRRRH